MTLLLIVISPPAAAQSWDTSGNGQLQGTYYFRQVVWIVTDYDGTIGQAISLYGNITFDGNGNYTLSAAQVFDSSVGVPQTLTGTGTYSISASGFGFISSPISSGDNIQGSVARGIFTGSTTEAANYNDLFIAAPLASPLPTNAFFQGSYTMMHVDFPFYGSPYDTRDSVFQLSANGSGGIGTVRATGYIAGSGGNVISQNISGVRYHFSNGAAVVDFGGFLSYNNLLAGQQYLYFSPDGNFVFGGSPEGFEMIVGVKSGTGSPAFSGLYYQAGVFQDESYLGSSGYADLDTYYGSLKSDGQSIIGHQRLLSLFNNNPLGYTYSTSFTLNADGTYESPSYRYVFGDGGAIRIGSGKYLTLGINIAILGPTFTPSGVYIYPTGVVNAASSALFTAGVAPGELITIYGSNLASTTSSDPTFPFTFGGVQVSINNRPAPVWYVSPTQISAVVPFATTELAASIQVVSNGVPSNTVTSWVNLTAPGVFTIPSGGIGYAAALHSDHSVVSSSSPAHAGETISLYVTGLGAVSPAVADGAPGPTGPYSLASSTFAVYIGGVQATTSYVGLAPQLVGLYQINVQIPTGLTAGDNAVDISGPDFYTTQALLPVQ